MKVKSVSSLTCYVLDLDKTVQFYSDLGFDFKTDDGDMAVGYINWFSIKFLKISAEEDAEFKKEAHSEEKGAGIYIYLSVEDVDEAYKELVAKGYKPSSEPRDWPWGNREFVIRDPDGYKLVLFAKK